MLPTEDAKKHLLQQAEKFRMLMEEHGARGTLQDVSSELISFRLMSCSSPDDVLRALYCIEGVERVLINGMRRGYMSLQICLADFYPDR